ncbi:MAG: hypothetical protein Q8L48_08765 [Archangium sp.]|nr:hypothetical protein [Archangium sp.]
MRIVIAGLVCLALGIGFTEYMRRNPGKTDKSTDGEVTFIAQEQVRPRATFTDGKDAWVAGFPASGGDAGHRD